VVGNTKAKNLADPLLFEVFHFVGVFDVLLHSGCERPSVVCFEQSIQKELTNPNMQKLHKTKAIKVINLSEM
jgi:hypothetical protein